MKGQNANIIAALKNDVESILQGQWSVEKARDRKTFHMEGKRTAAAAAANGAAATTASGLNLASVELCQGNHARSSSSKGGHEGVVDSEGD